jgi:PAS domain S-box-containing protein
MTPFSRDQPDQTDPLAALLAAAQQLAHAEGDSAVRILAGAAVALGGAARALLIRRHAHGWHVVAEALAGPDGVALHCPADGAAATAPPVPALRAIAARDYAVDRAVTALADGAAPALCLPLSARAPHAAWLYLEPTPSAGGFSDRQRQLVELLAAQAGAVFDNADLRAALAGADNARAASEDALRRNQAQLAEALEVRMSGTFRWRLTSGSVILSDDACAVFGVPAGRAVTLDAFLRQVHLDDLAHVRDQLARAYELRADLAVGYRHVMADGSFKHIDLLARPSADAAGQPEFVGAVMDVTARMRSQGALEHAFQQVQLNRNEFRLAIDHIPGLVWSAMPDGYIDFLNLRWLQYTGLDQASAGGWGWQSALHPDDLPELLVVWRGLLEHQRGGEIEARLRRHDGVYRWFLFRAAPLFDESGKLVKWYGQTTDVEDLKRAEALLAGEKRLLEMITRGTPLAQTFGAMCLMVDSMVPEALSSIALRDPKGGRSQVAAPNLPADLAALLGAADGAPQVYRQLAAQHGLQTCLSTPIVSSEHEVLGMFALHSRLPGPPSAQQQFVIDQCSHLASVAIERNRIDAALRHSEERFRRLAETTTDLIRITDLRPERVVYANPSFERVWARSVDELYNEPALLREAIHPDDLARVLAVFRAAASGDGDNRYDIEFRLRLAGGAIRWIHERGVFVFDADGRARQQSSISTDITERKAGEAALRASQERFALATAASADGIWDLDISSDAMFMSERAQHIFGLDPGPTVRPRAAWSALILLHPEGSATTAAVWDEFLSGAMPALDGEWKVRDGDGSVRWVRLRALCVRDGAGRPVRLAGSVSDIDAQKRFEAALAQARRLEAMGTLAGGIAHDFNNILGAILGYGEMALRGANHDSRLRRDVQNIITAGERGRCLVERILTFSRSGAAERIAVHVEQVVREAVRMLLGSLPANITLDVRLSAGRAAMLGSASQVHQVVMNLASNAIQAMPGGGTVRIALHAAALPAVLIASTGRVAAGDYLVLQVADDGCGVEPDHLDRIFDPFFTTKDVGVGTGLGLSLVHGIVLDVGGAIDVVTSVGAGSSFTVYLPRTGDAAIVREAAAPAAPRGHGERILVVDDEEPLVRLAEQSLTELGYEVSSFTSSAAALEAFRADPGGFDAVLTDERMPGMSGSVLIGLMREMRPALPVMLMSGYLGEAAPAGRQDVADAILKKPLSMADLGIAVAGVLSGCA